MNLSKKLSKVKKYDYLRAFTSLFCQKLVLQLKMDTINAHMLSYTNTHGFKFGIPNLIQQMAITEKACIFNLAKSLGGY